VQETGSGSGLSKLKNMKKSGHEELDFIGLTRNERKEYPKQAR